MKSGSFSPGRLWIMHDGRVLSACRVSGARVVPGNGIILQPVCPAIFFSIDG
jgi:ribosomal protein L24E